MMYPSLLPRTGSFAHRSRFMFAFLFLTTIMMGAGCQSPQLPSLGMSPTSTTNVTAVQESTTKLLLAPGDSFEVNQTFLGLGGVITQVSRLVDGVQTLTVKRFIPGDKAEASFETVLERETDTSRSARADAEAQRLKGTASGTMVAIPEPVMERVVTTGTLVNINLKSSHELYLPVYWKTGENSLLAEKSGLWLSNDAFQELVRTKKTVLDFGLLQSGAATLVKNVTDLRAAFAKLKQEATAQEKSKDPLLLEVDSDQEVASLVINGKETKVSVIRAHNWFGEVTILNNPQNPLILRMSFNPLTASAAELMGKDKGLKTLFGYEIKTIHAAAF